MKNLGIGTGRRKTAVARVYLREGSGKITVNNKDVADYFVQSAHVNIVRQPLQITSSEQKFDVIISLYGGGINGQAGACRMGIARALCQYDHENYSSLRANGFVTRDSRMVERKKYGQRGARRRFQFSKR
jgi:small subunit ribosomal protein S9